MLEAIPNLILKDTEYSVTSMRDIYRYRYDYKVTFEVSEFINFTLYKDGTWEVENWNDGDILLEGKVTPPASKSWVERLIKSGYSGDFAYAVHIEWKSLKGHD